VTVSLVAAGETVAKDYMKNELRSGSPEWDWTALGIGPIPRARASAVASQRLLSRASKVPSRFDFLSTCRRTSLSGESCTTEASPSIFVASPVTVCETSKLRKNDACSPEIQWSGFLGQQDTTPQDIRARLTGQARSQRGLGTSQLIERHVAASVPEDMCNGIGLRGTPCSGVVACPLTSSIASGKRRVSAHASYYEARTLLNESANRVGEDPCRIMCSTNPSRREIFSGVMPCIFHLDILRGKDCRWACTNSCGWQ